MNTIGCAVYYADTATANDNERVFVTAQDLGLQAIDLLYLLQSSMFTPSTDLQAKTESTSETASKRAFSEMDDLIEHSIRKRPTARPDREIRIAYTEIGSGGQAGQAVTGVDRAPVAAAAGIGLHPGGKRGGVAEADIKNDSSFVEDLGADSLDNVELVMALEEEFETEIPDEAAEKITNVQQAVDYINANLKK